MALIKRADLANFLKDLKNGEPPQVCLCLGERYLAREAADLLQQAILAGSPGTVHTLDGDREDPGQTLARITSFSLLPGRQIFRVSDSRIFHSKAVASAIWTKAVQAREAGRPEAARRRLLTLLQMADITPGGTAPFSEITADQWQKLFGFAKPSDDLAWADNLAGESAGAADTSSNNAGIVERFIEVLEKGLPPQNILILTCEEADRRQRLFTAIKKHGLVVDCAVPEGAGTAAQGEQKDILREMMLKTLKEFGKKIEPQALDIFFERVGFHPVAVVMETEKLALHAGDRTLISIADLDEMVGRSREDALFELTDAFAKGQAGQDPDDPQSAPGQRHPCPGHPLDHAQLPAPADDLSLPAVTRRAPLAQHDERQAVPERLSAGPEGLRGMAGTPQRPSLCPVHELYRRFRLFLPDPQELAGPAPCGRISPQGFAPAPASRPRGTLSYHAAGQTPRTKEP